MTEVDRFVRAPGALWRTSLDGVVVLGATTDEPVLILGTGTVVWELLEFPTTLDELGAALATRFDVSPREAASDVQPVLEALSASGSVIPLA